MNLIIDKLTGPGGWEEGWEEGWEKAADKIESDKGRIIILGAPDSGKTTLTRFLVDRWTRKGLTVAMVDSDMGQSTLGPPSTIGLGIFNSPPHWLSEIPYKSISFVGFTSPEGHFLSTIVGVKKMTELAGGSGADITLIDSTGLVYGNAGRLLKSKKIDVIAPAHIVAIQEGDEIEHLLIPYIKQDAIKIHRVATSKNVKTKSKEQRRSYREIKFREYFKGSKLRTFSLGSVGILGSILGSGRRVSANDLIFISKSLDTIVIHAEMGIEEVLIIVRGGYLKEGIPKVKRHFLEREIIINDQEDFRNILVGLYDENNNTIAIGVIDEIDLMKGIININAPLQNSETIRMLHFGSLKLDITGREIGKV